MHVEDKIELLGEVLDADPAEGADGEILHQAIERVFALLTAQGEDPEDDKWLADRDLFLRVVKPLIVASWRQIVGDETAPMPWADNSLRRAWLERPAHHVC